MQRKFLEELGIEKDTVDKIMGEYGDSVNSIKGERDNFKTQLDTAQATLSTFKGVDVNDLKGKIETLQTTLKNQETEFQDKINNMKFDSELDSLITSSGAKNIKAIKALLDVDTLKTSKNRTEDIKTALETVKTENDYMFSSGEPFQNPVASTNINTNTDSHLSAFRMAMGLTNETK